MDNSDDLFNDSFVLDDDIEEALQQAETKHSSNATASTVQSSSNKTISSSQPPAKRQKLSYGVDSSSDDEKPDIAVREDGSYNILTRNPGVTIGEQPRRRVSQSHQAGPSNVQRNTAARLERAPSIAPGTRVIERQTGRTANVPVTNGVSNRTSASSSPRPDAAESQLQNEIAKLRAQVEQLNRAHAETETALKKATDAQYAREGEVKILRQLAAKTQDEHAAEVAKLQATKAAAEEKQAQMEKEQKAAIERIRTQLTFNQLDVQASARKAPGSVRSRTPRQIQVQSPLPLPPNMRAWTASATGSQGLTSTPMKARHGPAERSRSPSKRTQGSVAPKLNFPGFENSFMQSTPIKSPTSARTRKPSGLAMDIDGTPRHQSSQAGPSRQRDDVFSPSKRSPSKRDAASGRLPPKDDFIQDFDMEIPQATPQRVRRASSPAMDFGDVSSVMGSDIIDMAIDSEKGDLDDDHFDGLDFREEFHRVLLSHTSQPAKILTFQVLMSTQILEDADAGLRYQFHCSEILNALGDKLKFKTLEDLMTTVASEMVDMAKILLDCKILSSLQILMELLRSIVVYLPLFSSSLLCLHPSEIDVSPKFVDVICKLFKTSFDFSKESSGDGCRMAWESLTRTTLHLLSAMVWLSPEEQALKLSTLSRSDSLYISLLDASRDLETIAKTTLLLVACSTHPPLTKFFLTLPDIDVPPVDDRPKDLKRIPLLERLNALVADCDLSPIKNDIIQSIIDFYVLIIINNPEGRIVLLNSNTIVPSIVRYLHELTTQLYEDDERLTSSPDAASTAVHMVSHTLRLLHLLVFTKQPSSSPTQSQATTNQTYNLRYALYHAPHVHFNGVVHMFMVMIGRLSYADAPEWLNQALQTKIERLTDPARDLMELVIDGPEIEDFWAAYQGEAGEDDDEENEARSHDV
ncbi:hypothetical protein SCHPADRAFT_899814 [Schizopora paradoxa]|uniref:DNA repair protein Rad26 n=1 Tax=Schizopora paradoxa TaxID=27342 RepID=A0A0H2S3A8_9AGAM|nr:hypothetical protein SCHPADRAFT_899814 [Schizopora paradoxa]